MEKDFFKDRHPDCRSMKAVQEAVTNQREVFICEKIMQTTAETLHDLTRVLPLAILSNDDHPRGLKVKGMDEDGHIKIGRITYFIYKNENNIDCILTLKGLIPIEHVLYKGYYYFLCDFKIKQIKNYVFRVRLVDNYFYREEQLEKFLENFSVKKIELFPKLLLIESNEAKYELKEVSLIIDNKDYGTIKIEILYDKITSILKNEIIEINLINIERNQVQ